MLTAEQTGPERIRPLSRSEYDQLVSAGAFEDERVELLYGTLVNTSPQDPKHAAAIRDLAQTLFHVIGERGRVQVQLPLALSADSEPEPDIAIVPAKPSRDSHPTEAFLVVEVAVSSLKKDREVKGRLYAEAGVPEYWVLNLKDRVLERYLEPRDGAYARVERLSATDVVSLAAFPDLVLSLSGLLP